MRGQLIHIWIFVLATVGCSRSAPPPLHESATAGNPRSQVSSAPGDTLDDVIELGADGNMTCALRADGQVYCWGRLAGIEQDQAHPRRVNGIEHAQRIEIHRTRSYALERSGDVVTWGGLTGPYYRHRRVEARPGGNFFYVGGSAVEEWQIEPTESLDPALSAEASVAAHPTEVHLDTKEYKTSERIPPQWRVTARAVTTRLHTSGTIFLADEMLCTHDRTGGLSCVRPRFLDAFPSWNDSQVKPEPELVDIAATTLPEICMLRRDGSIECVRHPHGDPYTWDDEHFRIDRIDLPGAAAAIASGWCGAVLLRDGRIVTWCEEDEETGLFLPTPSVHPEIEDGIAIDMGGPMLCVLRRNDHVTCWHVTRAAKFDMPSPRTITTLDHPTQLAVGSRHACALVTGGHVQCWGGNEHGQLGNGKLEGELDEDGFAPSLIPDTQPTWVVAPEPSP